MNITRKSLESLLFLQGFVGRLDTVVWTYSIDFWVVITLKTCVYQACGEVMGSF